MDSVFSTLELALQHLRTQWIEQPQRFSALSDQVLKTLPRGFVSHLVVVDAQGYVVYNSQGPGAGSGVYLGDRDFFRAMRDGAQHMVIGTPVLGRINNQWLIVAALPVRIDGRFAGAIHLLIPTEPLARRLAALALSENDVVALMHGSGAYLARSRNNASAMGKRVQPGRPFAANGSPPAGTYRAVGALDQVARTYGWHRMASGGAVLIVGLADVSVLGPLAPTLRHGLTLSAALSLLVFAGGCTIAGMLWYLERGRRAIDASEDRLEEAQRIAHLGNWAYDRRSQQLVWSDEVFRILDLQPRAGAATLDRFFDRVHPDDLPRVKAGIRQAIATHEKVQVEHRVCLSDGTVKHLRLIAVSALESGRLVRSHGTVQDITETRNAQIALQQLNQELEKRVAERTRELAAINRELDTFAYSVSHDLRTPLRSIHGFASIMAEDADRLSADHHQHLRKIQCSAQRMGVLITDLLSMARHSRAVAHHERVDLSQLAQILAAELGRGEPRRQVRWDIEPGLQARADPLLMRVVLQNLLGNAFKYTGRVEHAVIAFTRTGQARGMQSFCVRDNGAGFDMAYADQLFQPFKRLHKQDEFEGSGVGLATVQRVMQRHGGQVRGEGRVGEGAAFYFNLPDEPADLGSGKGGASVPLPLG